MRVARGLRHRGAAVTAPWNLAPHQARALRVVAQMPRFSPLKLMSESKSVIGLNMLTLWDAKQSLDELIECPPRLLLW